MGQPAVVEPLNADLFVSGNRAAENLLNGGLERLRHLTSFLNGYVLHLMLRHL